MARTSLSRATIYRRMALGSFPSPRKIGARSVWLKADIDRFCAEVAIPESGA
ncbi:helix-turn-helix transcriptional regulator [Stenotrophomonas maltophilia]|nr:AlpA family phage regulatory protein [Stenotrophomonas maltophilia]